MINIVLDTNILHQEGLNSTKMQLLTRLAKSDKVSIYIPELVKREFLSKKIYESRDTLLSSSRELEKIKKWAISNDDLKKDIKKLEENFKSLVRKVENEVNRSFEQWSEVANVVILDFDILLIDDIFESYFSGKGVFKKPKSRDDLPDAFISSCIEQLAEDEKLIVVIKDGHFRKHLDSIDNIETVENLAELFQMEEIQTLINELDAESRRVEEIKSLMSSADILQKLNNYLFSSKSQLDYVYVDEIQDPNDMISMETFDKHIDGINKELIENLEFGRVNYIDEDYYTIDFIFTSVCKLTYMANYDDFVNLPEERKSLIDEIGIDEDGLAELEEKFTFLFNGYMGIYLLDQMTDSDFRVHSAYLQSDESQIFIEINIQSTEII